MTSELVNHLWQSTLFAVVVALFAYILRRNRAAVRYALWLASSLKFLVPFSLLISLVQRLESVPITRQSALPPLSMAAGQITQPYFIVFTSNRVEQAPSDAANRILPAALVLVWAAG